MDWAEIGRLSPVLGSPAGVVQINALLSGFLLDFRQSGSNPHGREVGLPAELKPTSDDGRQSPLRPVDLNCALNRSIAWCCSPGPSTPCFLRDPRALARNAPRIPRHAKFAERST